MFVCETLAENFVGEKGVKNVVCNFFFSEHFLRMFNVKFIYIVEMFNDKYCKNWNKMIYLLHFKA